MVSDHDLRTALSDRVESLDPRVEAELAGLLARATRRRATRLSAYGVGLVAAIVAVTLAVGQSWRTPAEPSPVDRQEPARAQILTAERGTFSLPETLEPGPWLVDFAGSGATAYLEVDVPPGWSQDDDMVLTTGVGDRPDTRRIELAGDVETVWPDPCRRDRVRAGTTAAEVAAALAGVRRLGTGAPQPVTLDGHQGFLVRLESPADLDPLDCRHGWLRLYQNAGWVKGYGRPGWSDLVWLFDVDGRVLVIDACYGPEATADEVDELVRMVETATFVDPSEVDLRDVDPGDVDPTHVDP